MSYSDRYAKADEVEGAVEDEGCPLNVSEEFIGMRCGWKTGWEGCRRRRKERKERGRKKKNRRKVLLCRALKRKRGMVQGYAWRWAEARAGKGEEGLYTSKGDADAAVESRSKSPVW